MDSKISLTTGAWYGDREIELPIPSDWDVKVLWPVTTPPLTPQELLNTLESPTGTVALTKICQGKLRPLIIVDDLNRPTPTVEIIPYVLKMMGAAGIPIEAVKILMATGTHGLPSTDAILKKTGSSAANCQLLIHDCFTNKVKLGVTSYGTPVFVNKAILESDVIIGISGIYPNYTAGFGGGTKLALGVLGIQTICHLHFRHKSAGWGNFIQNLDFRRELDEIARMIGMVFNVSLLIDADRRIIKMYCGDPTLYFPRAVVDYQKMFRTQPSGDADVVISNAYPNDCSLTFARMKGFLPLKHCRPGASRIAIAACSEGLGLHNIWPFVNVPPHHRLKHRFRRLSVLTFKEILAKGFHAARRLLSSLYQNRFDRHAPETGEYKPASPVWLYQAGTSEINLPADVPGIRITSDWQKIVVAVQQEQSKRGRIKVLVYPCAFLQLLKE